MKFFGLANNQKKPVRSSTPLLSSSASSNVNSTANREDTNIHNLSLNDQNEKPRDIRNTISDDMTLQPLVSPAYEDVPMWNILPSYQLYQSTFSKNIRPSDEDRRTKPPTYETSSPLESPNYAAGPPGAGAGSYFPSIESSGESSEASSEQLTPQDTSLQEHLQSHPFDGLTNPPPPSPPHISEDDNPTRWENSILANTHRMKKLVDVHSSISNKLKIDIQNTDKPCQRGVKPTIIDTQQYEYQQGDSVHGFITVVNTSDEPLPFDMLSVVFEGKVSVMGESADLRRPIVFFKFLNMFDYSASWTPVDFDDSIVSGIDAIDPIDNSHLRFNVEKVIQPKVVYKKFFNFTIPERLLDCACEFHNLSSHCEAQPTIGLERDEFLKKLRKIRESNSKKGTTQNSANSSKVDFQIAPSTPQPSPHRRKQGLNGIFNKRIKDLSFPDTALSYSVEARIISKTTDYEKYFPSAKEKEEFIIVNEASSFVRVIPHERISMALDPVALKRDSELIYKNLITRIKDKIELGNELLNASGYNIAPIASKSPSPTPSPNTNLARTPSTVKRRQLYEPEAFRSYHISETHQRYFDSSEYEMFLPFKKKTIGSPPKIIGILGAKTPKVDYIIKYTPPYNMKPFNGKDNKQLPTKIDVPIEISFKYSGDVHSKSHRPPEIKSVSAELVVATYRSKKFPIPIEIMNDLKFRNIANENDNLETYVINPFKKYVDEISRVTSFLGSEVLNIDSQFIMDIKALANLSVKYNNLKFDHVKSQCKQGLANWGQPTTVMNETKNQETMYHKSMIVSVDIENLLLRDSSGSSEDLSSDSYALVPNFQSCIIGRYYYLKIQIKLHNHDSMFVKVPVTIRKL